MSSTGTTRGANATDDLTILSADFSDPAALSAWREHAPEGFVPKWLTPRIEYGHLVLQPFASGWLEDHQAGHLFKEVTGDFIVTTRIRSIGTHSELPHTEFSLSGLFVRVPLEVSAATWVPNKENWLFFAVGTASPAGEPQYEINTTTNSLSTLKIVPSQTGWVELRLARISEVFTLLDRPEERTEWRVVDQLIRPDLPTTLNVGLTAYADYASVLPTYPDYRAYNERGVGEGRADLLAEIDWVRFRRPTTVRFPIANIDAPAIFGREVIEARRRDLLS